MDQQLKEKLEKIVLEEFNTSLSIELLTPPQKQFGDKATNVAMTLARSVKRNPSEIAEVIKTRLVKESYISKVDVVKPGFINIFFNDNEYLSNILKEIGSDVFGHVNKYGGKKLVVEHTASNPNKYLHIGHLRNFCIGDSIYRLMEKTDYDLEVQWFNNDQGLQIAKVLWGLKNLDLIGMPKYESGKYDTYCGKIYSASEKFLNQNPDYESQVREMIQKMEEGGNEVADFAETVTQNIIKSQIETISNFDVHYDDLISESSLTQSGVLKKVLDKLLEGNKIVKETEGTNAGCVVIKNLKDSNGKDIPDKVLIRADGTAVYTAKDIALTIWKYGLMNVDIPFVKFVEQENNTIYISSTQKNDEHPVFGKADYHINVVDIRQAFPLEVVKQSLAVLGYEEASKTYKHLGYEVVALSKETAASIGIDTSDEKSSYAMSGRKGHEISIDNLLQKMTEFIKQKREELTDLEARKISAGALRYFMLKFGYTNIITFDLNEALKNDGDTGIYLQYSYVRAKSILQKATDIKASDSVTTFEEDEKSLIMKMYDLKDVLNRSTEDLDLQRICVYTFELCKQFSSFYQNLSVLNEADESKKALRVNLVRLFEKTLGECLDILGIYKPEKM